MWLVTVESMELPYAVFVDLNMPPTDVRDVREVVWLKELMEEVQGFDGDQPHAYNLLMFTNYPEHYGPEAAKKPDGDRVSVLSLRPKTPVEHPEALKALHESALQYGRFPMFFEE